MASNGDFELNIQAIRNQARSQIDQGAVTQSMGTNRGAVTALLQSALATELVCSLRYRQNAIVAEDLGSEVVAKEFWEHAEQEQAHADRIARRLALLGHTPDYNPDSLTNRSHADYHGASEDDPDALRRMLEENLVAERIAVEAYREVVRYIGDQDPTTRRLLEEILAEEEEHADEISALLHAQQSNRGESVTVPAT